MIATTTVEKDGFITTPTSVISKSFGSASHVKIRVAVKIDTPSGEADSDFLRVQLSPAPTGFGSYYFAIGTDEPGPPDILYSAIVDSGVTFDRATLKSSFTTGMRILVLDIDRASSTMSATVDGTAVATLAVLPFNASTVTLSLGVTGLNNSGNNTAATLTTRFDDVLVDVTP